MSLAVKKSLAVKGLKTLDCSSGKILSWD